MRTILVAAFFLCLPWALGCDSGTKIVSLEPAFGNVAGNDQVAIQGNGFKPGMLVQFGKREARSVIIDSPTRILVKTPAGVEGKVDVVLTRDDGKTFVLRDGFEYRRESTATGQ